MNDPPSDYRFSNWINPDTAQIYVEDGKVEIG